MNAAISISSLTDFNKWLVENRLEFFSCRLNMDTPSNILRFKTKNYNLESLTKLQAEAELLLSKMQRGFTQSQNNAAN
jgi:hypothetical protein